MKPISSDFHLENDSRLQGEHWWGWSVWVEGPAERLDQIESVTYHLHSSFPNPIRRVTNRNSKFKLESAGWGEFSIRAAVDTKDGQSVLLERWLQLGDGALSRGVEYEHRPIKVFIAAGIVDAPLVHDLTEALSAQGLEVVRVDRDLEPGQVLEDALDAHLRAADAVIAIFSDPPSRWVTAEAEHARKIERFVLPIVVRQADAPPPFNEVARLELGEGQNIAELANTIVSRVKDHVIEE